jgi:AraC-like DNA-binding protein
MRGVSAEELYVETLNNDIYIRSLGYKLVTIWECDWRAEVKSDPEKLRFLSILFRSLYPRYRPSSFESYVQQIRDGSFFGMIECDIIVPDELKSKFSEMAPIFKNVAVGSDQLGEGMTYAAEQSGYLKRPVRMLIGSLRGDKVLLASPLARWYLEQGLIITEIYQLVRYHPRDLFRRFGESVCDARREGDVDPDKKILADTCKLIGNSCYGKTITNKDRHRNVEYIDGHSEASEAISSFDFESLNQLTDDGFYETTSFKRQVGV